MCLILIHSGLLIHFCDIFVIFYRILLRSRMTCKRLVVCERYEMIRWQWLCVVSIQSVYTLNLSRLCEHTFETLCLSVCVCVCVSNESSDVFGATFVQ